MAKYKRYTISVGLNDRDTLQPVMEWSTASTEIAGRLAQLDVGATITRGTGVYKHERGEVVVEETVVITVIDFDGSFKKQAKAFYDGVKRDYNQESIAVMIEEVESKLV